MHKHKKSSEYTDDDQLPWAYTLFMIIAFAVTILFGVWLFFTIF